MKETMFYSDEFSQRHNSISEDDQKKMLSEIGVKSMDDLINLTIDSKNKFLNGSIIKADGGIKFL